MENNNDEIAIVRPYGDIEEINELSDLFLQQKEKGELLGYGFLLSRDSTLTAGGVAKELREIYRDHLAGNTIDITQEVLSGAC